MSVGLTPVKWETGVDEPPVRSQIHVVKLAEIVRVQLKQVGEDRLLLKRGGDDFNMLG